MEIIRGKIPCAKKVVIYGPEGIGKSTFASKFPNPLFIDTEGSTKDMDVARTPAPTSWAMLKEQINYVVSHPDICKPLVIDTADWAEQMCVEDICSRHQKHGIEDFGYGNGYVYVKEEFGRFLNRLEDVIAKGINVVLTAHAQLRKFEQPDELGAYDRYEMKLGKKTSSQTTPLVKEWADMVLFANYKTYSVATDKDGKKHKAQGGRRVMYTQHHPCWDAKNRYGLPEEVDFDYAVIASIIEQPGVAPVQSAKPAEKTDVPDAAEGIQMTIPGTEDVKTNIPPTVPEPDKPEETPPPMNPPVEPVKLDERIPKALRELMAANNVGEWDIQEVIAAKGIFTSDVPIWDYEKTKPGIIQGLLVAQWPKVYESIKQMRANMEIPFN